jgi:hypothetical protein
MSYEDKILRRYILFLPINNNTHQNLWDTIGFVSDAVGGCTFSRFHYPPVEFQNEEISGYLIGKYTGYPNEDVMCLITDVDISTDPSLHDKLKTLISKIETMGEEAVWLTYHDIMLCR